ncbi:Scr1 family TA system antitoxin-like transcriptional regulator [Streptomyces sp. NPDC055210]
MRPHEIEHYVSYRIKRQAVLFHDNPVPYTAIIHEAALRMQFGSQEVARAQLRRLVEAGRQPNITLRATPSAGTIPLRESEDPETILTAGPRQLAALISALGIGRRQNHSYD